MKYPILVNASEVKDLKKMVISEGGFEIGTGYTWTEVTDLLNKMLQKVDVSLVSILIFRIIKRELSSVS